MSEVIRAGDLNRRVELFKYTSSAGTTAERSRTGTSLGKRWVKRIDVSGKEEEEGKILPLRVCRFIMRFSKDVFSNGEGYFIRDDDGDYQVNNVSLTGQGRERFLELKCSNRGK